MLPRRGYEPVDDGEDNGTHEGTRANGGGRGGGLGGRSAYTSIPTQNSPLALEDRLGREGVADGAELQNGGAVIGDNAAPGGATAGGSGSGDGGDGEMTVRILDVQGQSYSLDVRPETTVRELKGTLVDVAGVEMSRQRIIWAGKILGDSDTLGGRNVTDGAAIHLFQRPKVTAAGAGVGTTTAQHPGRLHEIPPLLLQVQGQISGAHPQSQAHGYLDTHWEVDVPRRSIRFLASFLLMMSIMQLLECLASISAAMGSPGTGKGDNTHPVLPDEYWVLVRGRTVSSIMGIVVGVIGVRGAQSLNTQTIRIYLVGLVMCAIVGMAIRIEVLVDSISGKIPFGDYGVGSPDDRDPDGYDSGGGDPGNTGGEGRGEGEEGREPSPEEAQSSLMITAFTSFLAVVVSGAIWLLCIRRVNAMRTEIAVHMDTRERQQREMREEQQRARGDAGDARLEEGAAAIAAGSPPS